MENELGESGRVGDRYGVAESDVRAFHENGYISLPDVITEAELAEIEETYDRFMRKEFDGMGRDFCDMSGPYDREFNDYALINAVLPRVYCPSLQRNIYERISHDICRQLIGDDIVLDYDQFLAKKPNRPGESHTLAALASPLIWDCSWIARRSAAPSRG